MLHFLRHIRQKIILQDNVRKYLLYAVGEILLVVIGILIALQINNWNESRVENIQLQEYLRAIQTNVQSDLTKLRSDAIQRDTLQARSRRARESVISGNNDVYILKNAERFFYEFYFTPNRSGYQFLTNSGYIGKLANTRIDSLLSAYYIGLDDLYEREVSFNTFIENIELRFRTNHPPIRYLDLMRKTTLTPAEEKELLSYYTTNIFQAGVLRTSRQGTLIYYRLIEIGEQIVNEVETILD